MVVDSVDGGDSDITAVDADNGTAVGGGVCFCVDEDENDEDAEGGIDSNGALVLLLLLLCAL